MNIREIASACGVSLATVSRVLNGKTGVSQTNRDKILHYLNISSAQRQMSRRLVALIVPNLSHSYFACLTQTVLQEAEKRNIGIVLFDSHDDAQKELEILGKADTLNLNGCLFAGSSGSASLHTVGQCVDSMRLPLILIERRLPQKSCSGVYIDHAKGAHRLTEWLLQQGLRHIALINGPQSSDIAQERARGFLRAMELHGVDAQDFILFADFYDEAKAQKSIQTFLHQRQFQAAIGSNALLAEILYGLALKNKAIAREIEPLRIASIDPAPSLQRMGLLLPHLKPPFAYVAAKALDLLEERMSKIKLVSDTYIAPELML